VKAVQRLRLLQQLARSNDRRIVLVVLDARTTLDLHGSGFEARARLQLRASAYLVG